MTSSYLSRYFVTTELHNNRGLQKTDDLQTSLKISLHFLFLRAPAGLQTFWYFHIGIIVPSLKFRIPGGFHDLQVVFKQKKNLPNSTSIDCYSYLKANNKKSWTSVSMKAEKKQ